MSGVTQRGILGPHVYDDVPFHTHEFSEISGELIISEAQITSLSASKITAGTIDAHTVIIAPGGVLRSSDFVTGPGGAGWQLSAGLAEFNNITVRGQIFSSAGSEVDWTHLQNVSIVNADINDLSAVKINAGTLDVDRIGAASITTGKLEVTAALVASQVIRSTIFTSGSAGWQIEADGTAEFNDITVRGDLISGNWDGSDPLNLATVNAITAGFALDSSVGSMQIFQNLFIGTDTTHILLKGGSAGNIFFHDESGSIVPSNDAVIIQSIAPQGGGDANGVVLQFGFSWTGRDDVWTQHFNQNNADASAWFGGVGPQSNTLFGFGQAAAFSGDKVFTGADFVPLINNSFDLGSSALSWAQLHVADIHDNSGTRRWDTSLNQWHAHMDPAADNTYDLGDATLSWRRIYVHDIYDEAGVRRIQTRGNDGTLFYDETGELEMVVGAGAVTFREERFISSTFGTTASTSHNATVWDSTTFEEYKFTSKRELKKNIKPMDSKLSEGIYDLQLRTFDIKKKYQIGRDFADLDQHGMIADEVNDVFGDQAAAPDEHGEPSGWSDRYMTVMLLSEAQKHRAEIDEQRAEIDGLRLEVDGLRDVMEELATNIALAA
jgi:hypothetical protein